MTTKLAIVLIAIFLFTIQTEACPGLFGGGGGGCMAPPSPCGCGRKKREVLEQQFNTKQSNPCPQSEWKKIMESTMTSDPIGSAHAIQGALHKQYEAKFLVTCSKIINQITEPSALVSNGEGYCSYENKIISCEAVALLG